MEPPSPTIECPVCPHFGSRISPAADGTIVMKPLEALERRPPATKGTCHETRLPRGVRNDRGRMDHGHCPRVAGRRDAGRDMDEARANIREAIELLLQSYGRNAAKMCGRRDFGDAFRGSARLMKRVDFIRHIAAPGLLSRSRGRQSRDLPQSGERPLYRDSTAPRNQGNDRPRHLPAAWRNAAVKGPPFPPGEGWGEGNCHGRSTSGRHSGKRRRTAGGTPLVPMASR